MLEPPRNLRNYIDSHDIHRPLRTQDCIVEPPLGDTLFGGAHLKTARGTLAHVHKLAEASSRQPAGRQAGISLRPGCQPASLWRLLPQRKSARTFCHVCSSPSPLQRMVPTCRSLQDLALFSVEIVLACRGRNASQGPRALVGRGAFPVSCYVNYAKTQLLPSTSAGPTSQPAGSPTSGPVTKPPLQSA